MKKKVLHVKKLSLQKTTIAELQRESMDVVVGGMSQASACHSCMSQCLCTPPASGGTPCCPAPASFLCDTQDQQVKD